jgi:hypothetical protein
MQFVALLALSHFTNFELEKSVGRLSAVMAECFPEDKYAV